MKFDIRINDRAARRAMRELARRGENLEPAMRSIGELLDSSTGG